MRLAQNHFSTDVKELGWLIGHWLTSHWSWVDKSTFAPINQLTN